MTNLIDIENDVFDITRRLQEIDASYQIKYNLNANRFEVHSSEQPKGSYCFSVPYDQLDERTLDYAQKTRFENFDKIISEIEIDNLLLEEKTTKQQVELLKEMVC